MSNKIYLNKENIKTLKPVGFWESFYELNQVPRGSSNMKGISKFIEDFFKKYSNNVRVDEALNVTALIPATKGYENYPTVIIQGHMDMVCEKSFESKHNFLTDPISMYVEDGWVHADGTTLGGDNGFAIATMMLLASDKTIPHGPLELIATTDEEISMVGANAYHDKDIKGQYLINFDSELDNGFCIGSAGVHKYIFGFDLKREKVDNVKYLSILVKDCKGGHSATEINKKLINALYFLNQLNYAINNKGINSLLVELNGGTTWNSIPTFGTIVIAVKNDQVEKAKTIINDVFKSYCDEYLGYENPKLEVIESDTYKLDPIIKSISDNITQAFTLMINGVCVYDFNQSQMDSSISTGKIETSENKLSIYRMLRYNFANQDRILFAKDQIIAKTFNANIVPNAGYNPWSPKFSSNTMLPLSKQIYKNIFKKDPIIYSTPGGIECGIILSKCKTVKDAISFGPNLFDIHSQYERMEIESVQKVLNWICEILKNANKFN